MDEKIRSSGNETNEADDSAQKTSRRRRTPSAEPSDRNDGKTKRRSRSRSVSSHSRSPSRDRSSRRRRSRSRGHFSPDRYRRKFSRGGYQRGFNNRRRQSRSPDFRGRNRNARRSRSSSYDRYRNRRNASSSRDRSQSQGRNENNRAPTQPPPPPTTNYSNDYAPTHFQPEFVAQHQTFPNAQPYGNYDYHHPMMVQPTPTSFPAYPPPSQDYMWNVQVPPPPIISCAPAASDPMVKPISTLPISETDEEQQKRQAAIAAEKKIQRDTIRKQRDDYIRRASALKRELITLKEQRKELTGDVPPSPTTNNFIIENDRLQRIWPFIHCARLI